MIRVRVEVFSVCVCVCVCICARVRVRGLGGSLLRKAESSRGMDMRKVRIIDHLDSAVLDIRPVIVHPLFYLILKRIHEIRQE